MSTPQLIVMFLTTLLAAWCISLLVVAGQWPLVLGCVVVPGGALVHASLLASRGQNKAADVLLAWTFAGAVAFVAFADVVRTGASACD